MFTLEQLENSFAPQINEGHNTLIYILAEFDYNSSTVDPPNVTNTIKYINITEKPLQELYNELVAEGKWLKVGTYRTIVSISNEMSTF